MGIEDLLKRVRVYDNGGRTLDRYTVIYPDGNARTMSSRPLHPQGVCMWAGHVQPQGKRVPFHALPAQVREAIIRDLRELYAG